MQLVNPVQTMGPPPIIDRSPTSEAVGTLATSLVAAVEQFVASVTPPGLATGLGTVPGLTRPPSAAPSRRPCGCGWHEHCRCGADSCSCPSCQPCRTDPCDCVCCIGDADLVIYTRLGEARVVPIEVHNPRRRERKVSIELSDFTTKGGAPSGIRAQFVGLGDDRTITLGPCETKELILGVVVGLPGDERSDLAAMADKDDRKIPDVDDCLVAVADLRLVGCDIRPIRLAAAVMPRRCAAYEIDCRHGCC